MGLRDLPVRGGYLPPGVQPTGSLTAETPSLRDRLVNALRVNLFTDDRAGQDKANRLMDVLSYTPVGVATDMYDAGRGGAEGNYGGAALTLGMAGLPGPSPKGFKAYHGSPHSFDRFDLSKIGTGEGAQAYGHGLYFADSEKVARAYRDNLLGRGTIMSGKADNLPDRWQMAVYQALKKPYGEPRDAAVSALRAKVPPEYAEQINALLDNPGSMYEVQINADPNSFLDWDKPLSEQSDPVRSVLNDSFPSRFDDPRTATGQGLYKELTRDMGRIGTGEQRPEAFISDVLNAKGIPGIKFLDAGSRTKGDGSRNYVVFDDKLIEILRKYGLAGLIPTAAGAAAATQQHQDQKY